jgi:hypothetical protein
VFHLDGRNQRALRQKNRRRWLDRRHNRDGRRLQLRTGFQKML